MLDRTLAPPFVRSTSFELIQPIQKSSAKGADIFFVLGGMQTVSKTELIFPAGRWQEKVWGASYFSSQMLSKGTRDKNSYEIAQLFDHYGSHLEINPGLDFVSVAVYALNKNLEASIVLLLELLQSSVFPEKELTQLKSIYLQNLRVNREKTSFQSSVRLRRSLYGDSQPYGKELEEQEVSSLSKDQLIDHFDQFYKTATIIVSGNASAAHQKVITDAFGCFANNPLRKESEIASMPQTKERQVVSKEGSVQSSIRLGKRSIGRTHTDYAGVVFLNHILGGYFGSRLMKNIREEKGLSYGISSSLTTMIRANHLAIGADVNLENVGLTFQEIRNELNRLRTESINPAELEIARNHFIGSLQLEITTSFAHADKIKNLLLFNLPNNFYQQMILLIDKIGPDDLIRIANEYFHEDSFLEIAVG